MEKNELIQWLEQQIAGGSPGMQLPVDAKLQKAFALSRSTVRRVMSEFARQGKIVRIKGEGNFVPGGIDTSRLAAKKSAPQRIMSEVTTCIARGEMKIGQPLPQITAFSRKFNTSARNVSAAYSLLCDKGLASRAGSAYMVGSVKDVLTAGIRDYVYFVLHRFSDLETLYKHHEAEWALKKLELELLEYNHRVLYTTYERLDDELRLWRRENRCPRGLVLFGSDEGLVSRMDFSAIKPSIARLRNAFKFSKIPVLCIAKDFICKEKGFLFYSMPHMITTVRRKLAHYITSRGIANAIIAVNEKRCAPGRSLTDAFRIVPEIDNFSPAVKVRLLVRPISRTIGTATSLLRALYAIHPPEHHLLRMSKYRPWSQREFESLFATTNDITAYLKRDSLADCVVFNDEQTALEVLNAGALQTKKRTIKAIGLENSAGYAARNLTCCIPDWETTGYLLAHALIGDIPVARSSRGFIDCSARVIERR
jgi:DNA-binding transcriptional regulator YhcF (GntR family)